MTPKEKAEELIEMFLRVEYPWPAKVCALVAVDEILKSKSLGYLFTKDEIYSMESTSDSRWIYDRFMEYWEEVKQEIQNIIDKEHGMDNTFLEVQ
jgi:hypothetical protein